MVTCFMYPLVRVLTAYMCMWTFIKKLDKILEEWGKCHIIYAETPISAKSGSHCICPDFLQFSVFLSSRLKLLNQELEAKDKKLAKLREKRERVKAIKEKEPKQLSKRKFEPLDLEFNLGEDLKGNLRSVKPEGNILEDRYKSFQRRNIIEPTIKQR